MSPNVLARDQVPTYEVVGGSGRFSWGAFVELWHFRDVLWAFAVRQIKIRYKQAVIGVGWAILQPIVGAALFAVFLGHLSGIASEGAPYLLFALAGMVAWTYFSTASGQAIDSLVANQALLRKVYFPREVLPLAAIVTALVDLVPGLATLVVAAAAYGVSPSAPWLAAPLLILLLVAAATAFSLPLAAVNVYYRDVRYALPFVLQVGLYASPVVYSLQAIPSRWREAYAILNPVAAVIDGFRRIFIHGTWPDFTITLAALGWTVVAIGAGYAFFKRVERGISDRV